MIILCAGSYSSGSTWIFNLVRKLVALSGAPSYSVYCPSAGYMLSQITAEVQNVVVKSHTVDRDFWTLGQLADVRIIRSQRDPRDALASLMERFGLWYHDAFNKLEQSIASLSAIPTKCNVLDLRYESKFTKRVDEVYRIASFLDVDLTEEKALSIFRSLLPDQVSREIKSIQDAIKHDRPTADFDAGTHWQSTHLRTGETGTWTTHLDNRLADAVLKAMMPLMEPDGWHGTPVRWASLLFYDKDLQRPSEEGRLVLPGAGQYILSGPDLFLPSGCWSVELLVRAARSGHDVNAVLELFTGGEEGRLVASRWVTIAANGDDVISITFDHADERDPIAIRLLEIAGNRAREIIFKGATLTYLGVSRVLPLSDALPILRV